MSTQTRHLFWELLLQRKRKRKQKSKLLWYLCLCQTSFLKMLLNGKRSHITVSIKWPSQKNLLSKKVYGTLIKLSFQYMHRTKVPFFASLIELQNHKKQCSIITTSPHQLPFSKWCCGTTAHYSKWYNGAAQCLSIKTGWVQWTKTDFLTH